MSGRKVTRRPKARDEVLPKGFVPTPIFAPHFLERWLEDIAHRSINVGAAVNALRGYPFQSRETARAGLDVLNSMAAKLQRLSEATTKCADEIANELQKEAAQP